ncbi:MAG: polysaccharide pyruvyl transferase CsaB [Clostridia bacterium]|nr:polysaccharide pyruvyl transferase CsaB [Clostridia bacterium]
MKIIHIAGGGDKGGAKTHIFALTKHLSKTNDLTLVSMRKGEFPEDAVKEGIKTKIFDGKVTLFDMFALANYIRKEKPDIVHCHGAKANLAGVMAKLISPKTPFTTTVHSDYRLDYMHSRIKKNTFGVINSVALRFFDFYTSVSDNFKKMLIERGFKADKIMPIYNGLDFNEKTPPFDKKAYLQEMGLDYTGDEVVLGIAARLTPVKDIPTLLKAFSIAYKQNEKLRLIIGGDGDSTDMLKNMAVELGIDKAVCFCGWVSDIGKFFSACDIDVLCSISESFPYSILEGIRAGCAVISSDVGGVTNMIDSGENGYIFQPKDYETFAREIVDLSLDKEKRDIFAKKLYERASKLYSIENMAARQEEIYNCIRKMKFTKGRKGVLICGAYGRGNSGDEAILEAIISTMREIDDLMPITVMTRKPRETEVLHFVRGVYTFNIFKFIPSMLTSKLFISGGGSLIQNVTSTRSLLFYLFSIWAAKICGCKVLMYGCGIGEVMGKLPRAITKAVIDKFTDVISVRDTHSLEEIAGLGITKPEAMISADPAFSLIHSEENKVMAYFNREGIDINKKYICFSVRSWKDFDNFEVYAKSAKYAYEKYGLETVFMPIEVPKDIAPSEKVAKYMTTPYKILTNPEDIPLIIGIMKKMQMVCAVRLHALVFAAHAGVPFAATSYDVKVKGFMDDAGASDNCIDLRDLNEEWLCRAIDNLMQKEVREKYTQISDNFKSREQRNKANAARLLGKEEK